MSRRRASSCDLSISVGRTDGDSADRFSGAIVVALLCFQAVAAWGLITNYSATVNETGHIPAGLIIWYQRDFSLYNVNPPLAKVVATAPLILRNDISLGALLAPRTSARDEFVIGQLFSEMNSEVYHEIIITARASGIVWLFFGGLLLWRFAFEMFGRYAGLAAVALWVTEPLLTAHGSLVTPDLPGTVMAVACVYVVWRKARVGDTMKVCSILQVSIVLGVAILTKFTNLVLVVVIVAVAAASQARTQRSVRTQIRCLALFLSCGAVFTIAVIWSGYLFDGFGARLDELSLRSQLLTNLLGGKQPFATDPLSAVPLPLPPEMIHGIDVQQVDFEGRQQSYMRGVAAPHGWPHYYVYALLVKMTIGGVILCVSGLAVVLFTSRRMSCINSLSVLLPIIVFFGVVSAKSSYTNHARYVLPCLPFLILCASRLAESLGRIPTQYTRLVLLFLITSSFISSSVNYPNWLGYFNEAAGGPNCGWWHLEDSNVDWGQDLLFLRKWIDTNPERRPIYVCSHHVIDPKIYLQGRISSRNQALYIAVDAYSLVHNEPQLWQHELVDRVGTSFFIFRIR